MKKYKIFIVAFIVIGTFLSSFHYHSDSLNSEHCSVCIIKDTIDIFSDIYDIKLQKLDIKTSDFVNELDTLHSDKHTVNYSSRAPPYFS